jgi:hypothetical protein
MIDRLPSLRPIRFGVAPGPPVDQGRSAATRRSRCPQCPVRRQRDHRPDVASRSSSASTTRSSSPPGAPTTGRGKSRERLPGVIGSAAFVAGITATRFADLDRRWTSARGSDRQRQCRARRPPDPLQDAADSRLTSSAMPSRRSAIPASATLRARPARAAPDRDDSEGAGRARPSGEWPFSEGRPCRFPAESDDAPLESGLRKS